jgi:hypothetical protein
MLWLKRMKILINKIILNNYLTTTCKSLKEFVQNVIVKILKKIEKEEVNNLINVNLVIMFGLINLNIMLKNYLRNYIISM